MSDLVNKLTQAERSALADAIWGEGVGAYYLRLRVRMPTRRSLLEKGFVQKRHPFLLNKRGEQARTALSTERSGG